MTNEMKFDPDCKVYRGRVKVCGERTHTAKVTTEDVHLMRALHDEGIPTTQLAKKWDISQAAAWKIVNFVTWNHIR